MSLYNREPTMQDYTPIIWNIQTFAFVPSEAYGNVLHYCPKAECNQICNELNEIVKLYSYVPKAGDIYFHPVTYVRHLGGFIVGITNPLLTDFPILHVLIRKAAQTSVT